ncbi:MAG TPA: alpha/beta fold hydrolase [Candidatus Cybelea sp.]|nr:alpha/beta fold hydrolase [Candidatus Cybelea sp.]
MFADSAENAMNVKICGAVVFSILAGCTAFRSQPPTAVAPQSAAQGLHVGSVTLRHCLGDYYCGSVPVALDPSGEVPGKINIAFAWLPHTNAAARSAGTIVAVEGGPGYPSIASRASYRGLYRPLLGTRDLLMVDNRGTGSSAPVVCDALQHQHIMKLWQATRCGEHLGKTSDLYGTALAADDMAAVLDAMHIHSIDMYGDSYGSFFVQAFAGRHPKFVRSIVLDGAYQVVGGSAWYPSTAPTLRDAFDDACTRSPVCAGLPGTSLDRIGRLVEKVRAERGHITPSDVAFVMDSAGLDPLPYRDLDAAARAYLGARDAAPLQRLVHEAYSEEEGVSGRARYYSQGLFVAASCADNPQAYDMRLPPAQRQRAWRDALAQKRANDPRLYAPFTIDEFLGIPLDYAYVPLCQTWPVASPHHPPSEPVPPGTHFPNVPVLVLNGDLDTITTAQEGEKAARLFARASHVIVANTGHVTALDDFGGCAETIVRKFTQTKIVDPQCASQAPALHLVPAFSRTVAEVTPATPLSGNAAPVKQRRAAADAVLAAADVLARSYEFGFATGSGLRGGTYTASPGDARVLARLAHVRWTNDLSVSGSADFEARRSHASAHLTLAGASTGTLDVTWPASGSDATAVLDGTIDGYHLHATMPAP